MALLHPSIAERHAHAEFRHPTLAEQHEYRDTQRRLVAVGFIPPRAAFAPRTCANGHTFTPTDLRLRRWEIAGTTLWLSDCDHCGTSTSWEAS